ncbi:MAG: aminotransferase class I/II-fold pyridoxal phosphate-dependent enzyme, partial [Planctomycetota bacterium]|nr:aminotransferase class I/II-fold pyridoxal phosphate-dependent enzyme [Planctomycetota bacterium]
SGLHDPLETAGAFCREHDLWFHVDAAHGASALLAPELRGRLRGIEQADSVVWDAHKMLQTSSLCAAVLVRRPQHLEAAFRADASYLGDPDASSDEDDRDPWTRTLECTRPVLALKLFLNLAAYGEGGMGERVAALYGAARRFHTVLSALPEVECLAEPESNILCFRVGGAEIDQSALRRKILAEGSAYLTQATIHGRVWLRLTVMNPASAEVDVRALAERLLGFARSESRHANS